ncbi:MAG: hypothetical protein AAF915_14255 [Cyanobacteria bacterium P01_D01_bin.50]
MTVEAINSFANKVAQDAALKQEIETSVGIPLDTLLSMSLEQVQGANKDYPALITEIAAKNGFEFSKDELIEQICQASSSEELSDEQLEAVAGGKGSVSGKVDSSGASGSVSYGGFGASGSIGSGGVKFKLGGW